jgi:2-oxoisovalerate dehydrogenase E1 component
MEKELNNEKLTADIELTINSDYTKISKEQGISALRKMITSRLIDAKSMNLLRQGRSFFYIAGSGHEAIQIAVGEYLNPETDWFFPYYRDLAFSMTMGITPYEFFLQVLGKADDPGGGARQLPAHFGSKKINMPTQSSCTGTQFLQAVGTALASVKSGKRAISYVSSGEGTTSQGEFHEAVNWAGREKLPVLFLIQNNKYAISVPVSCQSGGKGNSIAEMMKGYYNLLRIKVDGTDYAASLRAAKEAVEYIRAGKGPALIEAEVVRLLSHSSSDDQKKYRNLKELDEEKKKDPITRLSNYLILNNHISEKEIEDLKEEIKEMIEKTVDEAAKQPDPDPSTATRHVFDESGLRESLNYEASEPAGEKIVMVDAINHAMKEELKFNKNVFVFGEDVADDKGGVFTATKGLSTMFGGQRVFNSPLAEASIAGVAAGMALAGLKPVAEIQFGDYIWPAFMQFKDEISTFRYRSNNSWPSSFVTRVAVGGYIHGGLYHSQNIESIFAHVPGIMVAYPSNAADAKGLLKTAIRINDPVIFCEHKGLYRQSFAMSPEPDENYLLPFGKAKIVQSGEDITVISYGAALWDAVYAAKKLEEAGYSAEVIDIRTIVPLDEETIYNSVKKTGKAIIVHEDTFTAGFGAEIAARVSDNCFRFLDGPVKRIAAKDCHIPYQPALEKAVLPSREEIYKGIKELIDF